MSFKELLNWVSNKNQPVWQRDALRRIAERGELIEDDLSVLRKHIEVSQKLYEDDLPELEPLAERHLSKASSDFPKTVLASIGPVKHVDRLEAGQPPIRFAVNGITLIYGANGSGKSGYCRITKQLCRSLVPDKLRGNVYNDAAPLVPEVSICFGVGGNDQTKTKLVWRGGEQPPPELARISVFDTASARVYVDEDRKIEFLPYELDLLNKLGLSARKLDREFKAREDNLNTELRVGLPTGFNEDTEVSGVLAKLIPETVLSDLPSKENIEKLAIWTDDEQTELDRLVDESRNDPAAMASLRREAKQSLEMVRSNIFDCVSTIGDTAIKTLLGKQKDAVRKGEVAKAVASELFKEQPISDIGSETWQKMFKYAREFALEVWPDGESPPISTAGRCVLCQQELDDNASARLKAFDAYLEDRAAADASAAETAFNQAAKLILNYNIKPKSEVDALLVGFSALDDDRKALTHKIGEYFEKANARLTLLKTALEEQDFTRLGEFEPLSDVSVDLISDNERKLAEEIVDFDRRACDDEEAQKRKLRVAELDDRKKLSQQIDVILDRQSKLEERLKLIACRELCQLAPITRQISARRKKLLTPTLKHAFDEELSALQLTHIPISLNDKGELGNSIVEVALSVQQRIAKNSEVLSEGEQRGLALACFLAELAEIGHDHGIIVDDPVSSLDQSRMQSVARRLAQEASKGRQVIIFTHNILFHHMLSYEAELLQVTCHEEWMSSLGDDRFGIIDNARKPWQMKDVSERLMEIDRDYKRLIDSGYGHSDQNFRGTVVSLYTRLRETWERVVEEILLNKVVQRFRPEIMTQRLEQACIDPAHDYPLIFKGMKRCSHFSGHDRAESMPDALPDLSEIAKDIKELKDFVSLAKNRKKELKKAGSNEDSVKPILW